MVLSRALAVAVAVAVAVEVAVAVVVDDVQSQWQVQEERSGPEDWHDEQRWSAPSRVQATPCPVDTADWFPGHTALR